MKVHYPKLYNMAHLSLNVFTASKGSNNYILFIGYGLLWTKVDAKRKQFNDQSHRFKRKKY